MDKTQGQSMSKQPLLVELTSETSRSTFLLVTSESAVLYLWDLRSGMATYVYRCL